MAKQRRRGTPDLIGDGAAVPRRGRGYGLRTNRRRPRLTGIGDWMRGKRTKRAALWDEEWLVDVHLVDAATPAVRRQREWYARNAGELLLGLGWRSVMETTVFVRPAGGATPRPDWSSCFAVEFPIAAAYKARCFEFDVARVYPARFESTACRRAHRFAVLDLARENALERGGSRSGVECLVESWCECFTEGESGHEGSLWLYRWR